jgi:hypothetical protein
VDDRERQIVRRSGVGSLSRKAQRVGDTSEGSTLHRSYPREAFAVKSRVVSDSGRGRERPAVSGELTECGDATVDLQVRCGGAHRVNHLMR